MSPQIIELLLFAAIAFFIINKLISILGTSEDHQNRTRGSKFGEPVNLKDVTESGGDWNIGSMITAKKVDSEIIDKSLLADRDNVALIESLNRVGEAIDKFNATSFVKNSSKAWRMIINAVVKTDMEMIEQLVDRRYIEKLLEKLGMYKLVPTNSLPDAKISDVTFFGNNIMIKVLFTTKNIAIEEWTFTRNSNQVGQNWFLSNIDAYIS